MWFKDLIKNLLIVPVGLFIFGCMPFSCRFSGSNTNVESDTTHIKKLANFLHDDEIDSIMHKAPPHVKGQRYEGVIPWPQPWDDFRGKKMDTIFWEGRDIPYLDMRGVTMRSAYAINCNLIKSDFRASDIR